MLFPRRFVLPLLAALVSFAAVLAAPATVTTAAAQDALGIDTTNFDASVRPQNDLYRSVNGTWLKNATIPADKPAYGTFLALREKAQKDVRKIIEETADSDNAGAAAQKISAYYTAYLDSARVEERGLQPLQQDFERVEALSSKDDLASYFAHVQHAFGSAPFGIYVNQDDRHATQYALYATQSGLGLPDRSYYLEDQFAEERQAYRDYIAQLYDLADFDGGEAAAQAVLDLETKLARAQWTRVESRDAEATYNKKAVADLARQQPHLRWPAFLEAAGADVDSVIVRQPSYFASLDSLVAEVPLATWKTYFRMHALSSAAPRLPQDFVDARFQLYGKTLSGQEAQEPRWKRAVDATNGALGQAVGQLYVDEHFPPEAKAQMEDLIGNLRTAFRNSIQSNEWMTDATKQEALDKLEKFHPKVAYPEEWKDYSALKVEPNDLIGNARREARFDYNYNLDKLGQPVDRQEWFMTPQTVNAYYNPNMNEIVFPAAILQPPFFDPDAAPAVNYGGIGAVIGHEMSHGFDDQGRKYNGNGNLTDWWTKKDAAQYEERAQALVDQYSAFTPLDSTHINGELTLGENLADLAGLTMAHRAYLLSLDGQEPPVIDGLTGNQRFFLGWAQVWRSKERAPFLRQSLKTDPHSPGEYRANGVVRNLPSFYEAFDVQPGDDMYLAPGERVMIW